MPECPAAPVPLAVVAGLPGSHRADLVDQLLRVLPWSRPGVVVPSGRVHGADTADLPAGVPGGMLVAEAADRPAARSAHETALAVRAVARTGAVDGIVAELSGAATPQQLIDALVEVGAGGVRVEQLVTAVPAAALAAWWHRAGMWQATTPTPARSQEEILAEQVELATLLVVTGQGQLAAGELEPLVAFLRGLNPGAVVVLAPQGRVSSATVAMAPRAGPRPAAHLPGWSYELDGAHLPGDPLHGLESFALRVRRPFHPGRLRDALEGGLDGVLRSRGRTWLASRPDLELSWSQAGGPVRLEVVGRWWRSVPDDAWPTEPFDRLVARYHWHRVWGDRRTELAFLGRDLDPPEVAATLGLALLDDCELAVDERFWRELADPFVPTGPPGCP